MIPSVSSPSNAPASVGKLRTAQIAHRTTWSRVPDQQTALAAMHLLHIVPEGSTTVTVLNPLDPATVADHSTPDDGPDPMQGAGWLSRPHAGAPVTVIA